MDAALLVVTFDLDGKGRSAVEAELGGSDEIVCLPGLDEIVRQGADWRHRPTRAEHRREAARQ
jgi:hypothetical protein